MNSEELIAIVRRGCRERGGELAHGQTGLGCKLATPYGEIRLKVHHDIIEAHLLQHTGRSTDRWYGFDGWKHLFNVTANKLQDLTVMQVEPLFAEWLDRFYKPTPAGYPDLGGAEYCRERVLVLAIHHVNRSGDRVGHLVGQGPDLIVSVGSILEVSPPGWFKPIRDAAVSGSCEWVMFRSGLVPDPRFKVYPPLR